MSDILPDMKCDAVNVRIMTEADVSSVANIEKQCFSEPWSENAFLAAAKDDNYIFIRKSYDFEILSAINKICAPKHSASTERSMRDTDAAEGHRSAMAFMPACDGCPACLSMSWRSRQPI